MVSTYLCSRGGVPEKSRSWLCLRHIGSACGASGLASTARASALECAPTPGSCPWHTLGFQMACPPTPAAGTLSYTDGSAVDQVYRDWRRREGCADLHGKASKATLDVLLRVNVCCLHGVKLLVYNNEIAIDDAGWWRPKIPLFVQDHGCGPSRPDKWCFRSRFSFV